MSLPHPSPLTRYREKKGFSLGDLADALQCARSHLSRVERGEAKASPELAKRIEAFTGKKVTRLEILYPEDYMPRPPNRVHSEQPELQEAS